MEMIQSIFHEHPLIHCANNGQLLCHGCGEALFGEYCCCFNCGFFQNICSICDKAISVDDGFCICEQCWPQTPVFHQSCIALPFEAEMQISYRPYCLLQFRKESNGSDQLCDFCKQRHRGPKFRCGDCDFQVCNICALELIKYHQGQQHSEHFTHVHPLALLKLLDDDIITIKCKLCLKSIDDDDGPSYGCAPCKFYIHNSCRQLLQRIEDPFRRGHFLELGFVDKTKEISKCFACYFNLEGIRYQSTKPVRGYKQKPKSEFHPQCLSPLKQNTNYMCFKGHPLIVVENLSHLRKCSACRGGIEDVSHVRCVTCLRNFHLHCGSLLKDQRHQFISNTADEIHTEDDEAQGRIKHIIHNHDLILLEVDAVNCKLCEGKVEGLSYGCAECKFYIHNSCGEFFNQLRHPFHQRHRLTLKVDTVFGCQCNACGFKINDFRYRCDDCDFDMHPECVSLKADIEYKGHNEHFLTLIENMSYTGECEACSFTTEGAFFLRCVECDLNFHVQCGPNPLPSTVFVEQHEHRLALRNAIHARDQFDCMLCNKHINYEHPSYFCADCKYYAHVRCVVTGLQLGGPDKIEHFGDTHFLLLVQNDWNNDDLLCCSCHDLIKDAIPAYGCHRCKFYLHKSCAELPRRKQHPFHRHPLTLDARYYLGTHYQCSACYKYYKGYRYHCNVCGDNFNLDLDCSSLIPSIKLETVHHHTLTLFNKLYGSLKCDGCQLIPPNRKTFLDLGALYVRCVKCNFSRHLLCCPLPKTLQLDDIHHHPVTLEANFDDLFEDIDDEEYCCDVCETRRQAGECVYHCEQCNFVVDLDCVFSEIMQFLEGKCKDVETEVISREIPRKRKGLTYRGMLQSLSEEDKKCLTELEQKLFMDCCHLDIFDELKEIDEKCTRKFTSSFSVEDLVNYLGRVLKGLCDPESAEKSRSFLRIAFKGLSDAEDMIEKVEEGVMVQVGAYKTIKIAAQLLNNLLHKYGDFGASCTLTQNVKTMFLLLLCSCIQDMSNISLMKIKEDFIFLWWFWFKIVERAGFRVDFCLDHVKTTLAITAFIRDNGSLINATPFRPLDTEIMLKSEMMERLKAEIENLNKEGDEILSNYGSEQMISEASRLKQASKFMEMKAVIGLFEDPSFDRHLFIQKN